ncbi:Uncharacterised protein [Mycobacteroides abscessus subsp. abscessus]|nr:Uncharacterised protein [Mycobacteroides abscessus subsp. abscessus]
MTGEVCPARNSSWSWSWPVAESSSLSSAAVVHASPSRSCACSGVSESSGAMVAPPAVRVKWMYSTGAPSGPRRSSPRKSPAMPTGRNSGVGVRPMRSSISSSSSSGARPGRSHLLMTVMTGMPRWRQTWKSLRVCGSRPLAASMSMTAASTAVSTR